MKKIHPSIIFIQMIENSVFGLEGTLEHEESEELWMNTLTKLLVLAKTSESRVPVMELTTEVLFG